jgi:hypothetical protein
MLCVYAGGVFAALPFPSHRFFCVLPRRLYIAIHARFDVFVLGVCGGKPPARRCVWSLATHPSPSQPPNARKTPCPFARLLLFPPQNVASSLFRFPLLSCIFCVLRPRRLPKQQKNAKQKRTSFVPSPFCCPRSPLSPHLLIHPTRLFDVRSGAQKKKVSASQGGVLGGCWGRCACERAQTKTRAAAALRALRSNL